MTLSEVFAVTGMPGLYQMTGKRNEGLILKSLETGQSTFVSARTHAFTALDGITIYNSGDGAELRQILADMKAKEDSLKVPDLKTADADIKAYVKAIVPDYDEARVYVSDMKKLLKWYHLLNSKGLIEELTTAKAETAADGEEKLADVKHEESKHKKHSAVSDKGAGKASTKPAPGAKKITAPRKAQ